MEIIDNFLPEDEFKSLQSVILSTYFPWNYIGRQSYEETDDSFQFQHTFYREGESPVFYYKREIEPILEKLGGTLTVSYTHLTLPTICSV